MFDSDGEPQTIYSKDVTIRAYETYNNSFDNMN